MLRENFPTSSLSEMKCLRQNSVSHQFLITARTLPGSDAIICPVWDINGGTKSVVHSGPHDRAHMLPPLRRSSCRADVFEFLRSRKPEFVVSMRGLSAYLERAEIAALFPAACSEATHGRRTRVLGAMAPEVLNIPLSLVICASGGARVSRRLLIAAVSGVFEALQFVGLTL